MQSVENPGGFRLGKFGPARIRTEVLAGLTVAMALVPEAVAFAFVAGVAPLSGLQAIDVLAEKYKRLGKNLQLRHLSPDCKALLDKAGDLMTVNVIEDPKCGVAVDYGARFDGEKPKTWGGISKPLGR